MITAAKFRSLALALPEAEEREHMGHPDFRVRNKIFATLWPDEKRAVLVRVPLPDREALLQMHPKAFSLNAWSHLGALNVHLPHVETALVQTLLRDSWGRVAPKRLAMSFLAK